jgi:hypothetical protein
MLQALGDGTCARLRDHVRVGEAVVRDAGVGDREWPAGVQAKRIPALGGQEIVADEDRVVLEVEAVSQG